MYGKRACKVAGHPCPPGLTLAFGVRWDYFIGRAVDGLGVATAQHPGKEAMRGYKDYDVKERLARAAEARQKALEKFKARPGPDDPEVIRRRTERETIAAARAVREAERAERKAKDAAERAARAAKERAEREVREKREAIEKVIRDAAEAAERKAERDRRYAARKARQAKR